MAGPAKPVTLITGASSGIGAALARRFARHGEHVVLMARRRELLEQLATEIAATGGSAEALPCDVTDAVAVRAAIDSILQRHGRIDRMILNAGGGGRTPPEQLTATEMRAAFDLNVMGVAHVVEAALPALLRQGSGQIVAIGSIAGFRGLPHAASYGAAKAALMNYIESLRLDLTPKGIAVTLAAPGFIVSRDTRKKRSKPMSIALDPAADILFAAIRAKRAYISFPWRLAWTARLLRLLPAGLYDPLIRKLDRR
ncbi:MAG TPA: SDR family NAD(P)-dependent oxidoreductase [Dongiaceae bacterium]|nr:SDR family NAD(P)-dependent oxidoreductase [Dongiaceae bacterium]